MSGSLTAVENLQYHKNPPIYKFSRELLAAIVQVDNSGHDSFNTDF
jgi:hypothetical protein